MCTRWTVKVSDFVVNTIRQRRLEGLIEAGMFSLVVWRLVSRTCHGLVTEVTPDLTLKRIKKAITMAWRAHKKNTQSKRKATTDKSMPGERRKTLAINPAMPVQSLLSQPRLPQLTQTRMPGMQNFLWNRKNLRQIQSLAGVEKCRGHQPIRTWEKSGKVRKDCWGLF